MGILDRIHEIESRMHEIQAMIGTQQGSAPTVPGQASFQSVMNGVGGSQASALPGAMPGLGGGLPMGLNGMVSALPQLPATAAAATTASPESAQFDPFIKEACDKWGVEESLVKAVIQQESNFNPEARSSCGAQGLMQLMPETARSLGVSNACDARENVLGGTRYLKGLLDRFNGDVRLALAAYNAGAGSVQKYGGVPPFAETQNYVSKIMANYERMKGSKG